jgi:nicotinamidase-related amidase
MTTDEKLDPKTVALVLIDLQRGIVNRPGGPRPGAEVVQKAAQLADKFRAVGATVVLVNVAFHPDSRDRLDLPVDSPMLINPNTLPPDWTQLTPEIGPQPGDLLITKHQWGAFYGTELDLQLRRRGVRTIVLAGIATNFGVESTARDAYERGYHQIFVEDAMTSLSAEAHEFVVKTIFPRIGKIRATEAVLAALVP